MNTTQSLDMQLTKLGFWSAVTLIVTGVLSTFLPLDIPAGVSAEHTERIAWLSVNSGVFIAGWLVQIAAMAALTGLFFAMAWQISKQYPLRGILGAMVILTSFVAFIIPKFIAIWSIPLQTSAIVNGSINAELANNLLLLLNVSVPFSLFTSFDYLGFWLYAVFAIIASGPLFKGSLSAKVCAFALGSYGVLFHLVIVGVFVQVIPAEGIELYAMSAASPLFIVVIAALPTFKNWQGP